MPFLQHIYNSAIRSSLRNRLILLFLLVAIGPLAALIQYFYTNSKSMIESNTSRSVQLTMEIVDSQLAPLLHNVHDASIMIYSDSNVQQMLDSVNDGGMDIVAFNQSMRLIDGIKANRDSISSIHLIDNSGRTIYQTHGEGGERPLQVTEGTWYEQVVEAKGKLVWVKSNQTGGSHEIVAARMINDLTSFQSKGILIIFLKESAIKDVYRNLLTHPDQELYVTDHYGMILSSNREEKIGWNIRSFYKVNMSVGGDRPARLNNLRLFYLADAEREWKLVSMISERMIADELSQVKWLAAGLFMISMLVIGILSVYVSMRISKPIISLLRLMVKVQNGDLSVRTDIAQRDEIGRLARGFNVMIQRLQEQVQKMVEDEKQKNEMQLRLMQMQINPHFLYNSLEIIRGLTHQNGTADTNAIGQMVMNLSGFYRTMLSHGREVITIKEELEIIEYYLNIHRIQLEGRLDYYIEADETLYNCRTLKLLLQPIVENAIVHGIKVMEGRGYIEIIVCRSGDDIIFTISDNGEGIPPDKLAKLSERLCGQLSPVTRRSGFGVLNVNQRIRLFFGENYGLHYGSEPGRGTTVTMRIRAIPEQLEA